MMLAVSWQALVFNGLLQHGIILSGDKIFSQDVSITRIFRNRLVVKFPFKKVRNA